MSQPQPFACGQHAVVRPAVPQVQAPVPAGVVVATSRSGASTRRVLGWIGFGIVAATGITVVLVTVTSSYGLVPVLLGALLALVPVGPLLFFFLWLDRFEREPPAVLAFTFVWGAGVATLVALALNTAAEHALSAQAGADAGALGTAVGVAPFVEEGAKGLAVLVVFLRRRREFDGIVDGIVYAGMVGTGFAFTENILYLSGSYASMGSMSLGLTFFMRIIMSPFAHPMFTAATGIGMGLAAQSRRRWLLVVGPLGGYLVAVGLHSMFNAAAHLGSAYLVFFLLVEIPLFAGYVLVAVLGRRREGRIITTHATAYAQAGWISAADAAMLGSFRARSQARAWATRVGGPQAGQAMRTFQTMGGELAFLRERLVRGTAAPDAAQVEYSGLLGLARLRSSFPQPG